MFKFIQKLKEKRQLKKTVINYMKNGPYSDNLFNSDWLIDNHDQIMDLLPESWTHIDNLDFVKFGTELALIGVPWENQDDLKGVLGFLNTCNMIIVQDGYQIRKNYNNPISETVDKIQKLKTDL